MQELSAVTDPVVSIIVPIYNGEGYLERFTSTLRNQSFDKLEYLFIDGNSTDSTFKILEKEERVNEKLRIISQSKKGIYNAMNLGIEEARGTWLFFMGVDDLFLDHHVLKRVFHGTIPYQDYDFIYGNVIFNNTNETYGGRFDTIALANRNIPHQACFYRKSLFQSVGMYDESYSIWADWELNIRLFNTNGVRILYIPETICIYNTTGTSGIQKVDPKFRREFRQILKKNFSSDFFAYFQERRMLVRQNFNRHLTIKRKDRYISELIQILSRIEVRIGWKLRAAIEIIRKFFKRA